MELNEYFKCKRCFIVISVHQIPRHHTLAHPKVPHDKYLDKFFNLDRPLVKCDFCLIKLRAKNMSTHMKWVHPNRYRANQQNGQNHLIENVFEISSDSECDRPVVNGSEPLVDQPVPSELKNALASKMAAGADQFVDKCVGEPCEMKDAAVNTERPNENASIGTKTDRMQKSEPSTKNMRSTLSVEIDEDGFADLVFTRSYR